MYRKNTAGQFICVQLLLTASGAVATGLSPAARRCIDGTFAAGGGTFTEDGSTGNYKYAFSQADTNGNNISINVTATGAMPVTLNIVTTAADPTDAVHFGLTSLPNTAVTTNGSLLTSGTGSDQLSVTSGRIDVGKLLGTAWLTPGVAGTPDVNTKLIGGQTASAAGTVTFPNATLASTANITGGTITTVTNLTNAPTAGDLTATMKTSVTTAATAATPVAASVTGAVGSVTGAVGSVTGAVGSVTGSVGSVVAAVAVSSNIKKNTGLSAFPFTMTDSTTHAPKTGVTVTAQRRIDAGAFAGCANSVTEVANGLYTIDLAAADLNGNTIALRFTGTSCDDRNITVLTQP